MKVGEEQLQAVRDIIVRLDEYGFIRRRLGSVVGLDDDFKEFQEQLRRVWNQLKEHLEG